jgi:predicted dienelactone hydrolase
MGLETMLLDPIKGHTFQAPPIVSGNDRYPVLVFSPGYGTNAIQYTALVEELVSHGYLVATVDHPFQSRAIAYPDGRIVTTAEPDPAFSVDPQAREKDYQTRMGVLAADLRFVLDMLTRLNAGGPENRFVARLDLDRVGVVGHSIGGIAASHAALADARLKVVANQDGHHHSLAVALDAEGRAPKQPFVELTDRGSPPTDKQLATWKISRAEFDRETAKGKQRADASLASISGGSFRITLPNIQHNSFTDMVIWDPDSLEARHRRIQMIRDYTRAFLDKFLRGDPQTLLDSDSSPYTDVTIERFQPHS